MFRLLTLLMIVTCVSCGGVLPEKKIVRVPASEVAKPPVKQRLYLDQLEKKYARNKEKLKFSIVRSMILELEQKYPELRTPDLYNAPSELDQGPEYKSLELTIEHLSHRELVKMRARHSAFHAAP